MMSIAPSFVTPLRYPGGKGRLGAWLSKLIEVNELKHGCYIEPYAGGAGAAVYLLINKFIDRIVINDIDPAIYSFWWSVFNDTESLIRLIDETPVTIESWEAQKLAISNFTLEQRTELGFATFFLNRTNRSGIINGGVIGGKDQKGKYLIDARYNKIGLIDRIIKLSELRDKVSLFNLDAMELIDRKELQGPECLIYLDPPYFNKGSQLYRNHYNPEDHKHIADTVTKLQTPWIVTYDNCEEIKNLYCNSSCHEFSFHYSTHLKRPKAKEIMFFGNLLMDTPPEMRR